MDILKVIKTDNTPEIFLNHQEKKFYISGISRPEDVSEFYQPVVEWMEHYQDYLCTYEPERYSKDDPMVFKFNFEYFNSSTAKFLFDILTSIKNLAECNIPVQVAWVYDMEDTDMKEAGEDLSILVGLEFEYIAYEI